MKAPWNASDSFLEINEMPFYWRLSDTLTNNSEISARLPIRITQDHKYDYLKFEPTPSQWSEIDNAYKQDANIGFLNPESGQILTYGSSVNNFFLTELERCSPQNIIEIGCGAGYSIQFLRDHGFDVLGVDPSEYSLRWSEKIGFRLINKFFDENIFNSQPDFIYCNDVFEHIPAVDQFAAKVFSCLDNGGVFAFATTNSTESIAVGDISMLEHQHVNMYTDRSIYLILADAGFVDIKIERGSYGNTFHVTAKKSFLLSMMLVNASSQYLNKTNLCDGFFDRASKCITRFSNFYNSRTRDRLDFYVPLRCIPYLSCVGDYGQSNFFDSNSSWKGKYIDGYSAPIRGIDEIFYKEGHAFFIGSLTFFDQIKSTLISKGYPSADIFSVKHLP